MLIEGTLNKALWVYLENITGASNVHLAYVIWKDAAVTPGTVFTNNMEERITRAPLNSL